jgi:hypothetical protein
MNPENLDQPTEDLPLLDVSGFHLHRPPGQGFASFDQQSKKEDAALQSVLGVPTLIEALAQQVWARRALSHQGARAVETVEIVASLIPVGRTAGGEVIAVALQLMVGPQGVNNGRWVGYVCPPDRYDALQASVEGKINALRRDVENRLRGLEGQQ